MSQDMGYIVSISRVLLFVHLIGRGDLVHGLEGDDPRVGEIEHVQIGR